MVEERAIKNVMGLSNNDSSYSLTKLIDSASQGSNRATVFSKNTKSIYNELLEMGWDEEKHEWSTLQGNVRIRVWYFGDGMFNLCVEKVKVTKLPFGIKFVR